MLEEPIALSASSRVMPSVSFLPREKFTHWNSSSTRSCRSAHGVLLSCLPGLNEAPNSTSVVGLLQDDLVLVRVVRIFNSFFRHIGENSSALILADPFYFIANLAAKLKPLVFVRSIEDNHQVTVLLNCLPESQLFHSKGTE